MALTPEEQSKQDRLDAKIKPVANGYVVKVGPWYIAKTIDEALGYVQAYLDGLKKEGEKAGGVKVMSGNTAEKVLAETEHTRLVCDGKDHRGVDKRTDASYRVQACDCKGKGHDR